MKRIIRRILNKYVDWERVWYEPKNKFKKGDKVKYNWKAKVSLPGFVRDNAIMIFNSIDVNNVVTMKGGESCNLYWLTKA